MPSKVADVDVVFYFSFGTNIHRRHVLHVIFDCRAFSFFRYYKVSFSLRICSGRSVWWVGGWVGGRSVSGCVGRYGGWVA